MNDLFFNKVLKDKIKSPLRFDFKIEKWNQEWSKVKDNASDKDKKIYMMGVVLHDSLKDIRESLIELYKRSPKLTYKKLLVSYIAISNRISEVSFRKAKSNPPENIHGVMLETGLFGTSLSLGEAIHGAVDGIQLAIRECLVNIEKNEKIKESSNPIDEIEFVKKESILSQLYSTYIHLWQCVLWGGYELVDVNSAKKIFRVEQPKNIFEISFNNSIQRKEKISAQKVPIANNPSILSLFNDDKFISFYRENKKKITKVKSITQASNYLLIKNTLWRMDEAELMEQFPIDWFKKDYGSGFCLSEVLNVMRVMMLASNSETEKYPENDSAGNLSKLKEFCPTVQAISLAVGISDATGIELNKINKIIEFLTYEPSSNGDLWCQPLIRLERNKYALLTSALNSPAMVRLFEHWVKAFDKNISQKGEVYEKKVVDVFNDSLRKNEFITDYNNAISKRIKLASGEEEIDLLARIDDLILIGEAKSIVTTDSEISKYRASEVLFHAGEQVIRKKEFLKNNLRDVFKKIGWDYDESKKYNIVGFIVNSSRVFVGNSFNDTPVIDELLLCSYFSESRVRLLTLFPKDEEKTIAWYELYSNIDELKENFKKYIEAPPQLNAGTKNYGYNEIKFPFIKETSYKISKKYLVFKPGDMLAPMKEDSVFPIVKSDDYELYIKDLNIVL